MIEIQKFNKIIVANWKLHGSKSFISEYLDKITFSSSNNINNCLIICPPIAFISEFYTKNFYLGSQDCSYYSEGAYTGEVSASMLKDIGCEFSIIGHSERRNLFNESSELIKTKLNNCIKNNIIPIFCIGENLLEKKENLTNDILKKQIESSLPKDYNIKNLIIAYEPVWAIGSGMIPSLDEINEIHMFIKDQIIGNEDIKVLYGGSVKSKNYKEILNLSGVDGLLVGGASINPIEFNKIINF